MADEVVLLDFGISPFGIRVRITLEEKGINYEYKEENLSDKGPLLLKMNPVHKKIPVLIHNGKPICESLVIVEYIDEVWKDKSPLMPSDPHQRAQARFWADFIDKKFSVYARKLWSPKAEEQEEAKKEISDCLKLVEGELGDKSYFGGENLGFVDVALIPYYPWFYSFDKCWNLSVEGECPKLVAWGRRCMERESVSKHLSDQHRIYEYVLQLKKRHGIA